MKATDAAYQVLLDAGKPLHYKELTKRILADRLWETKGKTPLHTVRSSIQSDIKKKGAQSRFCQPGPGIFALAAAPDLFPQLSQQPRCPDRSASCSVGPHMSFRDAAEHVLKGLKDGQRLHYRDLTERAIADGLIQTEGKTPEATMSALVGIEIRRREERGETQRFVREDGKIGLAKKLRAGINEQIHQHNVEAREELLKRVMAGTPDDFESLVAQLLFAMGLEDVEKTRIGQDGGVDVRGTLFVGDVVRIRMAVQAKRWTRTVGSEIVQRLRGSLGVDEQGLVITTSKFSAQAHREAERSDAFPPVALMGGEKLAELLAEHEVGVRRRQHVLITLESDEHVDQP